MSDPNEPSVLRAYHAASELLDEAPAPQSRAAILAAAARASGAGPQPVRRAPRWRLPLAAAASVLVGAIAILLATQVERSSPGGEAEVVAAAPPGPKSAPADAAVDAAPAPASVALAPAAREAAAPVQSRRDREAAAPAPPLPAAPTSKGEASERGEPAERPLAAATESAASKPAAPAPPAAAESREAVPSRAQADAQSPAAAKLAARGAGVAGAPAAEFPWRATSAAWIEKIVSLRGEGRHGEADAELAALRVRHPDLRLPPAALRDPVR